MNNPNTLNSQPLQVLRKEKKASIVAIVLFVIKAELLTSVRKISDAFMRTGNLLCYFQQNFGLLRWYYASIEFTAEEKNVEFIPNEIGVHKFQTMKKQWTVCIEYA